MLGSVFWVPSGFVVVESSGVGCRRLSVGRPGVPSSLAAITPVEDARAFDNLSRRFLDGAARGRFSLLDKCVRFEPSCAA